MKVAIVGAGFYGCYVARALKRKWGSRVKIELFEREARAMTRAATNNQARLHLGFHYPRSPETVRQTMQGYHDFKEEFRDCVHFPTRNLYAVHKRGLVGFQEYIKAMDDMGLKYEVCGPEAGRYFRDSGELEGVIRVDEGVIDLRNLDAMILSELKADIRCATVVSAIDAESGTLTANGAVHGPYDFIVNATYVDPNLGLADDQRFELKYEIAAMVVMREPFGENVALTVMDGDFVSLYPCGQGLATLSSVVHTPFLHCNSVAELEARYASAGELAKQCGVEDKILSHGEILLAIRRRDLNLCGLWVAPKTKLREDADATRVSAVRARAKLISILCGKLDAVHAIADEVLSLMDGASVGTVKVA